MYLPLLLTAATAVLSPVGGLGLQNTFAFSGAGGLKDILEGTSAAGFRDTMLAGRPRG